MKSLTIVNVLTLKRTLIKPNNGRNLVIKKAAIKASKPRLVASLQFDTRPHWKRVKKSRRMAAGA